MHAAWRRRCDLRRGRPFAAIAVAVVVVGAVLSGCGDAASSPDVAAVSSPAPASTLLAPTSASAQPSLADADDEGTDGGDQPADSQPADGQPANADASPAAKPAAGTLPGEPNAALTPGALNPDVTQATIRSTICTPGWTATIRPPSSYTTGLKVQQMAEYGYSDTRKSSYEEDHLISLELGGAPDDPKNLWPEPYTAHLADGTDVGAHVKDQYENQLHAQVCSGALTLAEARQRIGVHWVHWRFGLPIAAGSATSSRAPAAGGSTAAGSSAPRTATPGGSLAVRFTSLPNSALRGSVASMEARTTAGAACTARVTWPSGTVSQAKGLQPTLTAGPSGLVAWSWNVSSVTKPGTARASVTCRLGTAVGTATATFPLR
jgi:hypothetical protein